MDRKHIIAALVRHGHSAEKALEIAIDYERGDGFAKTWLATLGVI